MAATEQPGIRRDWRLFLGAIWRILISPPFLFASGVLLASRLWIPALLDVYVRSFTIAPNGFWPIASIVAFLPIAALGTIGSFLVIIIHSKAMRAARQRVKDGDPEAEDEMRRLRIRYERRILGLLSMGIIALDLLIPPVVALTLWNSMQIPAARREHGKTRVIDAQAQLRYGLRVMERRGIFTPFHSD